MPRGGYWNGNGLCIGHNRVGCTWVKKVEVQSRSGLVCCMGLKGNGLSME